VLPAVLANRRPLTNSFTPAERRHRDRALAPLRCGSEPRWARRTTGNATSDVRLATASVRLATAASHPMRAGADTAPPGLATSGANMESRSRTGDLWQRFATQAATSASGRRVGIARRSQSGLTYHVDQSSRRQSRLRGAASCGDAEETSMGAWCSGVRARLAPVFGSRWYVRRRCGRRLQASTGTQLAALPYRHRWPRPRALIASRT
jgi:hypothetical protein